MVHSVSWQLSSLGKRENIHHLFTKDITNTCTRYNALAGIADPSNSFFLIPVAHFPWSEKGRERRNKVDNDAARAEQGV